MIAAPYAAEDLIAREHLSGVAQEVGEQVELTRGEIQWLVRTPGLARGRVQHQVRVRQALAGRSWPATSEERADSRQELLERKRFRQVVVGAAGETGELVGDLAACGEHQDGYVDAGGPHPPRDF